MADVRYTTNVVDDFQRSNELYPPGILPPWYHSPGWDLPAELDGGALDSPSFDPNNQYMSQWRGGIMSGDRIEAWGYVGGDAPLHDAYYWGLQGADGHGYYIRNPHNVLSEPFEIYKMSGPNTGGVIASSATDHLLAYPQLALIQILGSTISAYYSTDAGANWTLMVSAVDSTYRDDLYMEFGGQGGGPGWLAVGGGPFRRRSQIYRRLRN